MESGWGDIGMISEKWKRNIFASRAGQGKSD
jgi:hypothetical protein